MKTGVVALQGAFARHAEVLRGLGAEVREVREPHELDGLSHVTIPGGESTTFARLARFTGLDEGLRAFAANGGAIWGTCMGMIAMAENVEGRPEQPTLGLLDIDVRRNAFGAQVHSFEDRVTLEPQGQSVTGVFIRAPIVTRVGPGVDVLATYRDQVVAVRNGRLVGTSFHPELTDETTMHEWFLGL